MKLKVCGLQCAADVMAAAAAKPFAVGLVFHPASPRCVDVAVAAQLLDMLPDDVERWAVFRAPLPGQMSDLAHLPLTGVQADVSWNGAGLPEHWRFCPVLHDGEDAAEQVRSLGFDGRPRRARSLGDGFVLDGSYGRGKPANLERAAALARLGPLILAGGLHAETVGDIVERVAPWAVDVSSGVEGVDGRKDLEQCRAFGTAVR
ncbi:MAG: phosphoribosylanthranilate isomerase [Myxococcota bacterium]